MIHQKGKNGILRNTDIPDLFVWKIRTTLRLEQISPLTTWHLNNQEFLGHLSTIAVKLESRPRIAMAAIPNIVVFGETGAGKSSLINLIAGNDIAPISSRSVGCTFQCRCYTVDVDGMRVNLHDTAGLDEGQAGTVAKQDAIIQLKESCIKNWRLFREIICQRRVPIVLAVTGLKNEEPDMDKWWIQNEEYFMRYEMYPNGVACTTATRGRQRSSGGYRFEEYSESQVKIRRSIRTVYLRNTWRVPPAEWFKVIVETSYKESGKSVEEIKTSRTILGSAT
ncbi:hypothetical protein APHAL10511_002295 [Amanita phalloides]|nr:hypothetical protein APHAL10511_002295 [Amanita phalloides]